MSGAGRLDPQSIPVRSMSGPECRLTIGSVGSGLRTTRGHADSLRCVFRRTDSSVDAITGSAIPCHSPDACYSANHLVGAGANSRTSWHSSRRNMARRSRPAGSCNRPPAGAARSGRRISENLDSRFSLGLIELPLAHELVDTGAVAEADIDVATGIYPTAVPWTSAVEAGQYVP